MGGGIGPVLGGYELDWTSGDTGFFAWSVSFLMVAYVFSLWLVDKRGVHPARAP
jgi:hypothetical protein